MRWYVARRVLWSLIATYLILSVTWGLLAVTPDKDIRQAKIEAAQRGQDAEAAAERIRKLKGMDRPLWVRYTDYMTDIVTLNWGWSESRAQPVTQAIWESLRYTVQYSVPWTLLTLILGPAVGLYSAANQYTTKDHLATLFAFFGYAIPNFWFGIILLVIFGVHLGWVPVVYDSSVPVFSWANVKQLILPVFVLTTGSIGSIMRVSRNESAEYLNADFVKTARAKGADERRLLTRHILRPASVPMSTTFVGTMIYLFIGASYLVEVVFGIPGLGMLTLKAIQAQDTALVLGTSFIGIFVAVIGNLLQDITYTILDPRISFGDR
ncbi:ABC transporter permease [Halorussus vallis]|nr:ABC transporter permease [Halorussus vallis]USZ75553.1 ABC transporter permease [Halorussus vallis]